MNKHKSNKMKENSNTVRHLIMGQIITTQNLVAIKEVWHAGQKQPVGQPSYFNELFIEYWGQISQNEVFLTWQSNNHSRIVILSLW